MGFYSSAYLVYGQLAPEQWDAEFCEDKLPAKGPLDFLMEGSYDWDENAIILVIQEAGGTDSAKVGSETAAAIGQEIEKPDVRQIVNARKLYEHLTRDLDDAPDWEPQWWLVPTYG